MGHTTFSFTIRDQVFFAQQWQPESPSRAVVAIIHGHGEHSGRYQQVAAYLNQAGMAVVSYDLYGHGQTAGKRGVVPSYAALLESVDVFLEKVRSTWDIPLFLMGHSMGGNIAATYATQRQASLRGVILSAPWIKLAFEPSPVEVMLARIVGWIMPAYTRATRLDATAISRDADEVVRYQTDPLIHDQMGAVLLMGCVRAAENLVSGVAVWPPQLPVLIMHGSRDRLTSFEASRQFAARVGVAATWQPWEGLYHEMHHEPERFQVLDTLIAWIVTHI
ncbi:MAG: alpha/beta hydrolase [Bacteroidia bacterium]|nr:alpha/beta hydrolase [Bacteroidia bacterium]